MALLHHLALITANGEVILSILLQANVNPIGEFSSLELPDPMVKPQC